MTHTTYDMEQAGFRFYADGTESGSTALAAEDTNYTAVLTGSDLLLHLRIGLQASGGATGGGSTFQLQYDKNGAASYANVTGATANVQASASASLTDDGTTSQRLTGFSGTFTAGRLDEADGNTTTTVDTAADGNTEILYSLLLIDADLANNDTLDFQVLDSVDTAVVYTTVPRITISKPASFTLTANTGAYTVTGQASNLLRGLVMVAAAGSYSLTGQTANFVSGFHMAADTGSYALTGNVAGLTSDRILTAEAGNYTLSGTATGLNVGRTITAETGTYTLTGQAANFAINYSVTAEVGSYTLSGISAALLADRRVIADTGAYTLTGYATGLNVGRTIAASVGSYTLTGVDAALIYTPAGGAYTITANTGAYTLTGQATALTAAHTITADAGAYTLTGISATLSAAHTLAAGVGSYVLTGFDAAVVFGRSIVAATGTYVLTGPGVALSDTSAGRAIDYMYEYFKSIFTAVDAAVSCSVYDEVPDDAVLPYIVIENHFATSDGEPLVERRDTNFIYPTVWSDYRGKKEASNLMADIYAAIHQKRLTMDNGRNVRTTVVRRELNRDADGQTYIGMMTIRGVVEHV